MIDAWSRTRWRATAVGACLLAALTATWPLGLRLASTVPLGTETAATVPIFDIWTLWWSGGRLWHGYAGFWDAPIFHPTAGAFAFSEPMLLPGFLSAPFFALHAPPALPHNLVLFATLTANGVFGCRLVRGMGVGRLPALLAGILVVTLPFFAKLQGELPILMVTGTLAALDGAVRFGRDGRVRDAAAVAAGMIAQVLCCQQLALFGALFVGVACIVAGKKQRFSHAAIVRLGGALALSVVVAYALLQTPLAVHRQLGFARDEELVRSLSSTPGDFLTRPWHASMPFPPREDPTTFTGGLFPGIGLMLLAALGAVGHRLRRSEAQATSAVWRSYAAFAAVGAVLLALGLNLSIWGVRPFALLRALPGFDEIRSAFRAAFFGQLALVCVAALGLEELGLRLGKRPGRQRLVLAAGLLAAAENLSLPAPLLQVPRTAHTAWTAFVAAEPPGTVVAHVPFPAGRDVADFSVDAWRMFHQLDHERPLVNGYASNFPAEYRELMFAMREAFPKPILACALHRVFGADLLIADQSWLALHRAAFGLAAGRSNAPQPSDLASLLTPVYADSDVAIFRLTPPPGACPPMRLDVGTP
jgi:hypothetical protein